MAKAWMGGYNQFWLEIFHMLYYKQFMFHWIHEGDILFYHNSDLDWMQWSSKACRVEGKRMISTLQLRVSCLDGLCPFTADKPGGKEDRHKLWDASCPAEREYHGLKSSCCFRHPMTSGVIFILSFEWPCSQKKFPQCQHCWDKEKVCQS